MGGHGGLNILPQKSWHVYRLDNKLKVDKDKETERKKLNEEAKKERNVKVKKVISKLKKSKGKKSPPKESEEGDEVKPFEPLFSKEEKEAEERLAEHKAFIKSEYLHGLYDDKKSRRRNSALKKNE